MGGNSHCLRPVCSVISYGDEFHARSRTDFDSDRRLGDAKVLCYQRNKFCVRLPIDGRRRQACCVRSVFLFLKKALTRIGSNFDSDDRHGLAIQECCGAKRRRSDSDSALVSRLFNRLTIKSAARGPQYIPTNYSQAEAVCRAVCAMSLPIQNMRIDHGRSNILVSEEFLDHPNIVMVLKQTSA